MHKLQDFSILELSNSTVIVVLNSSLRIDNFINSIFDSLKSKHFIGTVYFDFLLSNGLNSRRFFVSDFKAKQANLFLLKNLLDIPSEVLIKSNEYFFCHKDLLSRGVLTASAKERFFSNFN